MKRLLMIALNGAVVLALIVLLAAGVLWVRSYWVTDHYYFSIFRDERGVHDQTYWTQYLIESRDGRIGMMRFVQRAARQQAAGRTYREVIEKMLATLPFHLATPSGQTPRYGPLSQNGGSSWGGFQWVAYDAMKVRDISKQVMIVPFWSIALVMSAPIALRGALWLRMCRRDRLGLCRNCGYDMRATPERCPECGSPGRSGTRHDQSEDATNAFATSRASLK